ncbi:MAG: MFS transporter [Proteobacteria bacterium]|nr:MFS transporter [Pseudomonadota bacterium]MBU1740970.1 MFS transporter [Pseudomonadota bacterium]
MSQEEYAGRGEILSWMVYDFGNTAYSTMIVTFVFSVYFRFVICDGLDGGADLLWGLMGSVSLVISAGMAPYLGAVADYGGRKKWFLVRFTLLCVVFSGALFLIRPAGFLCGPFTGCLFYVTTLMIVPAVILFLLANVGFQSALVFYNAFLPELAPASKQGRVSGYGWAVGYLGSVIVMGLSFPLVVGGLSPANLSNLRLVFLLQAGFYLVFAVPLFIWLKERRAVVVSPKISWRAGWQRLGQTVRRINHYRQLVRFLIAFLCYTEGISTVIWFAGIFARKTFGFSLGEIIVFFIVVQTTGIIGAAGLGRLADVFSPKKVILFTLGLWLVMVLGAYFTTSKAVFWVLGVITGISLGSSQAVSRTMMSRLTPPRRLAEFFGLYGVASKFSAAIGPVVFGVVSTLSDQRLAILAVGAFFLVGAIILLTVDERAGVRAAREPEPDD